MPGKAVAGRDLTAGKRRNLPGVRTVLRKGIRRSIAVIAMEGMRMGMSLRAGTGGIPAAGMVRGEAVVDLHPGKVVAIHGEKVGLGSGTVAMGGTAAGTAAVINLNDGRAMVGMAVDMAMEEHRVTDRGGDSGGGNNPLFDLSLDHHSLNYM